MIRRILAIVFASMLLATVAACTARKSSDPTATPATTEVTAEEKPDPKPDFTTVVATALVPEIEVFETIPDVDCLAETPDTTTPEDLSETPGTTLLPWMTKDGVCPTDSLANGTTTTQPTPAESQGAESPGDDPQPTVVTHPAIPRIGLASAGSTRTADGWTFSNPTYFENPLVFVVTEQVDGWLEVMIPARPKETRGWIHASDVSLSEHRFHMELSLSDFTLRAWDGEQRIAETHVVVGTQHTRTPTGQFYISEKIPQSYTGGAYGPWIFSTNGYSEDLDLFDGGLPVIAFHGTNQPHLVGTQSSNGCVRVPNRIIELLAGLIPAGTPVNIVP